MRKVASDIRTMIGDVTQTISATGVLQVGKYYRSECSWEAVSEVIETSNLLVLLTDPVKGFMFPRASIPDEEYEALLAYSRERVAESVPAPAG